MKELRFSVENIGRIKEAELKINGISVIGGKNDQGKSTIGKLLMSMIIAAYNAKQPKAKKPSAEFEKLSQLLFHDQLSTNGVAKLESVVKNKSKITIYDVSIAKNKCVNFLSADNLVFDDCIFIQSPLVWDLSEFFSSISALQVNQSFYKKIDIKYPYILWHLYTKLITAKEGYTGLKKYAKIISNIIDGSFRKSGANFGFFRESKKIDTLNVATGIKSFGILQKLLENNQINKKTLMIFDEPENHLHATWQVEFAKILVELASGGVHIIINTHSPYFLEALDKLGALKKVDINFFLADNNKILQIENNNKTLELIYEKLNEPFVEFDKMEQEING